MSAMKQWRASACDDVSPHAAKRWVVDSGGIVTADQAPCQGRELVDKAEPAVGSAACVHFQRRKRRSSSRLFPPLDSLGDLSACWEPGISLPCAGLIKLDGAPRVIAVQSLPTY
jgi:hypothetical protein